jgi:hypothetical protein
MHHPGMNAEIARLRYSEALREAGHARRVEAIGSADVEARAVAQTVVQRLASRLVPELPLALRSPARMRRRHGPGMAS